MITRRSFLASAAATIAWSARQARAWQSHALAAKPANRLQEILPQSITLSAPLEESQRAQTQSTLAALEDDSLLQPFRKLGGVSAPGVSLGGWYAADGWAPGHCLGQWMSAMAREAAITANPAQAAALRARVTSLITALTSLGPALEVSFRNNAFPSYTYDKLLLGLMDAHAIGVPNALAAMSTLTAAAEPSLPAHAMDRSEMCVHPPGAHDVPSCLDENYTLPENQFLAYQLTGDPRYLARAKRFLLDRAFFDPLAAGQNALIREHAYSHMNALSSGLAAYRFLGDEKYLRAVTNAFQFVQQQSYPTGGWGPEEEFVDPATNRLAEDLTATHRGFETPCGSYAHFKLARNLLALTAGPHYGDSIERVLYNTVLGALPLETDGRAFYYSDYNLNATKGYFPDRWPCCGGTLPMVATDYRRNIYFGNLSGITVNLYQPSAVIWQPRTGTNATLTQTTAYPASPEIALALQLPKPTRFPIALRIPAFATGAEIAINGRRPTPVQPGTSHTITREWRSGDRVELTLPLTLRTEPLSPRHPEFVAVLRGPVVLFSTRPGQPPIAHSELIAQAATSSNFAPFTQLAFGQPYTLFQRLA